MRYVIEIPYWHPAKINQLYSGHWAKRAKLKKADVEMVGAYVRVQHVSWKAVSKRRVDLTITLKKGQRAGDPDAYWKSLLDALVACGALVDDNRQWCEVTPVQFIRGERMATKITLEDMP